MHLVICVVCSCIWDAETGELLEGSAQTYGERADYLLGYGTGNPIYGVSWHPSEHLIALSTFGNGNPVLLYTCERGQDVPATTTKD